MFMDAAFFQKRRCSSKLLEKSFTKNCNLQDILWAGYLPQGHPAH